MNKQTHKAEEKDEMAAFLQENIVATLDLGGVSLTKHQKLVNQAVSHLMKNQASGLMVDGAWIDRFGSIPDNMAGHIKLFKSYKFSPHDAVIASLMNPQLHMQPYTDTERRIEEAQRLLSVPCLDIKPQDVFPLYANKPRLFTYDPNTVAKTFKVLTAFLESPFVAFREDIFGSSFRQIRIEKIKSQFGSVSNALVRMAAAEMSFLEPKRFSVTMRPGELYFVDTSKSFHRRNRIEVEAALVQSLGFKGKGTIMDAPDDLLDCRAQKLEQERLKIEQDFYVNRLVRNFESREAPGRPYLWEERLLPIYTKDGQGTIPHNAIESREMRARAALHLLRYYKLACSK